MKGTGLIELQVFVNNMDLQGIDGSGTVLDGQQLVQELILALQEGGTVAGVTNISVLSLQAEDGTVLVSGTGDAGKSDEADGRDKDVYGETCEKAYEAVPVEQFSSEGTHETVNGEQAVPEESPADIPAMGFTEPPAQQNTSSINATVPAFPFPAEDPTITDMDADWEEYDSRYSDIEEEDECYDNEDELELETEIPTAAPDDGFMDDGLDYTEDELIVMFGLDADSEYEEEEFENY